MTDRGSAPDLPFAAAQARVVQKFVRPYSPRLSSVCAGVVVGGRLPVSIRIAPQAEVFPGYRLIERLGRGGFGEVWKAEAPGGMLKAIKFVYGNIDDATEDGKPAEQ